LNENMAPTISVNFIFFENGEGRQQELGRSALKSGSYRPHLIFDSDPSAYMYGIQFIDGPDQTPFGQNLVATAKLIYLNSLSGTPIRKNVSFKMVEGPFLVGNGTVLSANSG
jgi:hypothetical protein